MAELTAGVILFTAIAYFVVRIIVFAHAARHTAPRGEGADARETDPGADSGG